MMQSDRRDCACGSRCTTCADIAVPETDVFGSYESAASTTLFAGPYFDLDEESQPADSMVCGSKWPALVTFTLAQQQIYGGTKVWSESAGQYIRQYKITNYDFNPQVGSGSGGAVTIDPDSVDFAFELEYKKNLGLWQAQLTEFFGVACPKTLVVEAYPISTIPAWAGATTRGYTCMRYYAVEDGKRITPIFGTRCTGLIGISLPNPAGVMLSTIYSDFSGTITGSMAPYQADLPSFFFNIPLS